MKGKEGVCGRVCETSCRRGGREVMFFGTRKFWNEGKRRGMRKVWEWTHCCGGGRDI